MKAPDVKRIRTNLRWTQDQVADFCGVTKQSIGMYERGERPVPGPVAKLLEFLKTGEIVIRRPRSGS